ncbi:hypothetical protein FHS52_002397 [Erythromicrobium ramosum]|uniref:Uncharacterized protein n=1 Tax=Erythrobacter ramosus TaxID=35811 RepID=A0A6I4UM57_9SPHN|nr:hypothetical protein [Erythrobacter ramosus]MBB3776428.1 hypothetical protein [Erythrobacter ramosus]MXP38493.1 hypothetical protein [Erythrobacter ramosus]
MTPIRPSMILVAALLSGCATGGTLEGQRTVFSNPYVAPVIDQTGIGPECNLARGRDATCLGVPLTRKGRGNSIGEDSFGSYNRNQRRVLRERAELLRQISEQQRQEQSAPPPPPPEPTLPTAAEDSDRP